MFKRALLIVLSSVAIVSLVSVMSLSNFAYAKDGLSDHERFVSYPYLDKAYRLQAANNLPAAIIEIKKAIEVAPHHIPFQVTLFEYYIATKQYDQATTLYESMPVQSRGPLLSFIIEARIQDDKLVLSTKLKDLFDNAPVDQRDALYGVVVAKFIGSGQDALVYEWLQDIQTSSPDLLSSKIRLADKLGKYNDIEESYLLLKDKAPELERIYVMSLLKSNQTKKALAYANKNPKAKLSFDIYYQYLQSSIQANQEKSINDAFVWIESHHRLSQKLLEQKYEFAIQTNNSTDAFAVLEQLNASCSRRIDVALFFDMQSKAAKTLLACPKAMTEKKWVKYASSLLSTLEIETAVKQNVKYSRGLSDVLIQRYVARGEYQFAVNEIIRSNTENEYIETLAISYEKLGDIPKALVYWARDYNKEPDDVKLDKISFLYLTQHEHSKATKLLEERLIAKPQDMPSALLLRLLTIYQQDSIPLSTPIKSALTKVSNNESVVAEVFRVNGECEVARSMLNSAEVMNAQSLQTLALCVTNENPSLALQYWQRAYATAPSKQGLRAIAYAQMRLGNITEATNVLATLGQENWNKQDALFAAELAFQQHNYQDAERFWLIAKSDEERWLDFGTQLAIQQGNYERGQALSQQLLDKNGALTAHQWARQATIYQQTEQPVKASRSWEIAVEKDPSNATFKLSWAYSLIDANPQKAFNVMQSVTKESDSVDSRTWEQLAYLAATNKNHNDALYYSKKSIETESAATLPRGRELSWALHEYYRDLSQYWRLSASASQGTGGILGEVFYVDGNGELLEPPTNNLSVKAEYVFNPLTKTWSAYAQLSGNGTDDEPLGDWSKELGISYKPFDKHNVKATVGVQRFFSGDWEGLVRVNGDMLNQGKWRQGWRFDESWWERQFYFDVLWLPESEQVLGLGRFNMGYVHPLNTRSKQTLKYYGLAQYDIRKPQNELNGKSSFDQSSLGLGIQWRLFTTPDSPFARVHRYSLALEWRLKMAGELTQDDSSLLLIATYQY
jgi:tetratricopeptide (TPR) repeat protein